MFQNSHLDFSSNSETDDDIIGDAYEYLMKNFVSQSGKIKVLESLMEMGFTL